MRLKHLPLIALLFITSYNLAAEPITGFSYAGLGNIKPEAVDRVTSRYIGEETSDETKERLTAALRDLGLFSEVTVLWSGEGDGEDTGAKGTVYFEERQTFAAFPLVGAKDGTFTFGAAMIETNLFGMGKKIAAAGRIGDESMAASFRVTDPLAADGAGLYSLGAGLSSGSVKQSRADGTPISRFDSVNFNLGAEAGAYIGEEGALRVGMGFLMQEIDERENPLSPPESIFEPYVSVSAERSRAVWDGTFNTASSLSAETGVYLGDDPLAWVSAEIAFHLPIRQGVHLSASAAGHAVTRDHPLLNPGAKDIGAFLMNSAYSAPHAACVATEAEASLLQTQPGLVSAFAGFETSFGAGGLSGSGAWYGPMAGFRLYFRKLPLPGAALAAGYDLGGTGFRFAFSMGVRL